MDMIDKRNLSSHTYNLDLATDWVIAIHDTYYPAFLALKERLAPEL